MILLSAHSVRSRAALRPERAVLNQPEFQGWFVRKWAICVLSIDLCSGDDSHSTIYRFSFVRGYYICTSCFDGFAVLRPKRSGFRIARPGLGLVCGCRELCVLSEVLPPEVDWHSTDIFICFCVVIVPARFLLTSAILCHAVSNKLAFGEFIRPRMISLTLGTHKQTLDYCRGSYPPARLFGGVYKLPVGFHVVYA